MQSVTSQSVLLANKNQLDNLSSPSPAGLLLGGASGRSRESCAAETEKVAAAQNRTHWAP